MKQQEHIGSLTPNPDFFGDIRRLIDRYFDNPPEYFYMDMADIFAHHPERIAHPLYQPLLHRLFFITMMKQFPMAEGLLSHWNPQSSDADPLRPKHILATCVFMARTTLHDYKQKRENLLYWQQKFHPAPIPETMFVDTMGSYVMPKSTFPDANAFYQHNGALHTLVGSQRIEKNLPVILPDIPSLRAIAAIPFTRDDMSLSENQFDQTILPLVHTALLSYADISLAQSLFALE